LFTVLRNCYSKGFRGRLSTVSSDFDINAIPAAIVDRAVDSEQLQMALNALGDEFKIVVLMFYFEERSYREISALLEIPLGTVMSRLARGKTHLRRLLNDAENQRAGKPIAPEQNGPSGQSGSDWLRPTVIGR
jgi:RNA polymerase sigma-70 factor (ECF subfamily)